VSQAIWGIRKRVEEGFGWLCTVAGMQKMKSRDGIHSGQLRTQSDAHGKDGASR
jgi:hypothetical protein